LTGVNVLLLPVEYNYFRGVRTQDHVVLEWQTATEINCDYFEVQKSTDNQLFTTVLLVNGAGTSSSENDYKVEDVATENKTYYYRLKQYDFNGEFSLSSIIAITNTKDEPVVLRRISLLGEDVEENYYGIVIEILSDNTVRKKFNQSNN
jgi:hypothetical protein